MAYDDLAWFEANRPWISSTYPGKFVLIKNKAVVGAYPTQASAINAGVAMFGAGFSVKEATPLARTEYGLLGRRLRLAQAPPPGATQSAADVAEQLRQHGAVVTVVIAAPKTSQQAAAGQAAPPVGTPQTVKGMVDTGASISTVSDQVAQGAGLIQTGSVPLGGVGGTSERPIYAASFSLPEWGVTVDPIEVGGVTIPMPGIDILVGRDILRALDLAYHGVQGAFQLTTGIPPQKGQSPGEPAAPVAQSGSGILLPVAAGVTVVGIGVLFALKVI